MSSRGAIEMEKSGNSSDGPNSSESIPRTVLLAIRWMYVGAVLSVITFLFELTERRAVWVGLYDKAVEDEIPLDQTVHIYDTMFGVVVALGPVGAVLWIWMAFMNRKGRSWARLLGTGFMFFGFLGLLWVYEIYRGNVLGLALQTLVLVVGIIAVLLTWHTDSTPHYERDST